MTNKDFIREYVTGLIIRGKCNSLRVIDGKLYSYDTVIAQIVDSTIHLNKTVYSRTTTTQQNTLSRLIAELGISSSECLHEFPIGTRELVTEIV